MHRFTSGLFVAPLLLFVGGFLLLPALSVALGAFREGNGEWTLRYLRALLEPQYLKAFLNSIQLSLATALLGALCGGLLAYAVLADSSPDWLKTTVSSFSGVASNFAGVPLAFAFIATLGTTGLITRWLRELGFDLYGAGFSLFSFWGLVLVYLYFQIPLMFIVISPALGGLRREWQEAAANLGATPWQYWCYVGLPVMLPSLLAAFVLLFGNAFSAYATPYALTSGILALVPLQIGGMLQGNVVADPQQGQALALGMILVMSLSMGLYIYFERWGSRWRR